MSRLGEALVARNEARMKLEEAKHELLEAVVEAVERSGGGLFARDLSAEAELPTCVVIGAVQSAVSRGLIEKRSDRIHCEFVRLNSDGTINMNDKIHRTYCATRYTPSRREQNRW
jgi:GTP-sensing pleiotropic transcriptional regulator CodY